MPVDHLYVHVPFCARRCAYCDFSIAVRRVVPWRAFATSIEREVTRRGVSQPGHPLRTLYLGGGTPSRLGADGVAALLETLGRHVILAPRAEVTLEANPEDVDVRSARAWRAAGVTRVSLGVQSLDDAVLRWMHRVHDAGTARAAIETLRDAGLVDLSIDLIYALPGEVVRDWERDLDRAIALDVPHLSCYGLTVEPQTPLGRWTARGAVGPATEEAWESDFLRTHQRLVAAGYEHYEVSNFARPGARAVHNSAYWAGVPYLGLGPAAHGFDGVTRRWNVRHLAAWEQAVAAGEDPVEGSEALTAEQRGIEAVYLGLRSDAGLIVTPEDALVVTPWVREGWAESAEGLTRLTPTGWLRLDALVAALTEHRSRY